MAASPLLASTLTDSSEAAPELECPVSAVVSEKRREPARSVAVEFVQTDSRTTRARAASAPGQTGCCLPGTGL